VRACVYAFYFAASLG